MRLSRFFAPSMTVALLLTVSCEETARQGDGGTDDSGTPTCPLGVDKSVDFATAIELAEGTDVQGSICPVADQDYYKVTVPAGKKLIRIKLAHSVSATALRLTYDIFDDAQQLASRAPAWTGSGARVYDAHHCVAGEGTYFVRVRDESDNAKDSKNHYKLSYTTVADQDPSEPNDTRDLAKPPGTGAISCTGDKDYFVVNVQSAGKLLKVTLTNSSPNPVDLKYTILDASDKVLGSDGVPNGMTAQANLETIHAVPGPGSYYVVVQDDGDDDSDPAQTYTLTVDPNVDEPDPNEQSSRNDSANSPTILGSFDCTTPQTFTKTGRLASKADVDVYRVSFGSCPTMPVMEVSVSYPGSTKVDPQVTYLYRDTTTSCTQDTCCRVLSTTCKDFLDCLMIADECVPKGDTYCKDAVCEPAAQPTCATEKRCAGAVVCIEGSCGVEQISREDENGESGGAALRTAQPLFHPGPYFIRVTDFASDDYDYDQSYTLTVRIRPDPDGSRELNSQYFSEKVLSHLGIETSEYHATVAKAKAVTITPGVAVSGHLSYEGDQDWYVLPWPCTTGVCVLSGTFSYTGSCASVTGSQDTNNDGDVDDGLEFIYALRWYSGEHMGDEKDSFPETPITGTNVSFGLNNNDCWLLRNQGSYLFSVTDNEHNMWSWDCGYTFTISVGQEGCPIPPCADYQGTCYVP